MTKITDALSALARAEREITEAEQARDDAFDAIDRALAERGWRRMLGGFNARLYQQVGGGPVPLAEVLEHERRVAA